jgi:DNA-binding GntR family transcriptional regulator
MEQAIRDAVARFRPGHVFTSDELARDLGLDRDQVAMWLDLLAGEGVVIAEHRTISEAAHGTTVLHFRIPLDR